MEAEGHHQRWFNPDVHREVSEHLVEMFPEGGRLDPADEAAVSDNAGSDMV